MKTYVRFYHPGVGRVTPSKKTLSMALEAKNSFPSAKCKKNRKGNLVRKSSADHPLFCPVNWVLFSGKTRFLRSAWAAQPVLVQFDTFESDSTPPLEDACHSQSSNDNKKWQTKIPESQGY